MTIIREGFKVIPDHENYACSENGKVLNIKKNKLMKIRRISEDREDKSVSLSGKNYSLARIVCSTFKGLCPYKYKRIKYIDGDCSNVHYSNLEWHDQESNKIKQIENSAKHFSKYY
jgi:hypothetical protein